jgi:hypothetical protein
MKALSLFLFLIESATLTTVAQSYVGGSATVNAGYMWTPALSSSLQSSTGHSVNFLKGFPVIGTEFNYRNGNSIIALSGYFGTQEAQLPDGLFVEPFIWKANGGFGWIVVKNKSLFVYPVVGIGLLESSLTYHTTTNSDVRAIIRSASVDCGIHADYFLNQPGKEESFFSVAIVSLRLGYTKGLSARELQGLSLTVSFGGIAFMKHKYPVKI